MPEFSLTFVPGAAGLGSFWDPVVERLPSSWHKRTLDLPGLGPVPGRDDVQSYLQLADYVARDMDVPSVVVGQSMGGYVSLELALRYPERVSHLVLSVATGGVDMARQGARDWRADARRESPLRSAWALDPSADLTPRLHEITAPVLLIWATRDPLSPLGVAHALAARLPRARLVSFDTDDHWLARRFPAETATAIHDWLLEPR